MSAYSEPEASSGEASLGTFALTVLSSMLTTKPWPDVAPYHPRQVVVLGPDAWSAWLNGPEPEPLLAPSLAGTLDVRRAETA